MAAFFNVLKWALGFLFARPEEVKDHPINRESQPVATSTPETPPVAPPPPPQPTAAEILAEKSRGCLGKDVTPEDRTPDRVACADTVVRIVNQVWPGTLDPRIVGTDALFFALKRSSRFKASLDPEAGTIVVSPRTATENGHTGIYTFYDTIASNDSRTGRFENNYTRASWRKVFIQGRGLKGYLFTPIEK